jgi:hypothetical protein
MAAPGTLAAQAPGNIDYLTKGPVIMNLQRAVVAMLIGVCSPWSVQAQALPTVRVVGQDAVVFASRHQRQEVIATPTEGVEYEALDAGEGWVWVLLEPDLDGTRQPGWIEIRHVQIPTTGAAGYSMRGVAAEVEAERAASRARLAAAEAALERARQEYEQLAGSERDADPGDPPRP